MIRHGTVWCVMVRYGATRCGAVWYRDYAYLNGGTSCVEKAV